MSLVSEIETNDDVLLLAEGWPHVKDHSYSVDDLMSVRDKVSDDSDVVRPLSAAVGYTSVVWFASLVHCEATCASDRVSGAPSGFWARP